MKIIGFQFEFVSKKNKYEYVQMSNDYLSFRIIPSYYWYKLKFYISNSFKKGIIL